MKFSRDDLQLFYQYCVSLIKEEHLAYDLLQTTLEKWCRGNNHDHVEKPRLYFMKMIRNQFLDDMKKDCCLRNSESFDENNFIPEIGPNSLDDILITNEQLQNVFNHISAEEREFLFLWAMEEYTAKEIADYLDLPRGTVLSRIFRLRNKIKKSFEEKNEARRR